MLMRTNPRNIQRQKMSKNRLTSGLHGNCLVAVALLFSLLICVAPGAAQSNRQATATLRLSVYVIPLVSTTRNVDHSFFRPSSGNSNTVMLLATNQGETLESVYPLIKSPWAGFTSEAERELPTLTPSQSLDDQSTSGYSLQPQALREPNSLVPLREQSFIHTYTYIVK